MQRAAIQGIEGSFHHAAARDYLGSEVEICPCISFSELIQQVEQGRADVGVMAVENTIAGSLLPNYRLIVKTPLHIVGEIYAHIRQNLMALPGQGLADIQTVHSHPIALEQCRAYFEDKPEIRLVESEDTALSARNIAELQLHGRAAIAGRTAAELYGLEILADGIETNKVNYTRFWVLSRERNPAGTHLNKASLSFILQHRPGQLSQLLSILAAQQINLTKIQSLPRIGSAWEYHFFIDVLYADYDHYSRAIAAIRPLTEELEILGEYTEGAKNIAVIG